MSIWLGIVSGKPPDRVQEFCGKLIESKTQLDNGCGDMVLTT